MPQVLNIRHLPGFEVRQLIIRLSRLARSTSAVQSDGIGCRRANPFTVKLEAERETAIAAYERWLGQQPRLIWSAGAPPQPCHGDVLLRLANE